MKKGLLGVLLILNIGFVAAENKSRLVVGITVNHFYPEWLMIYRNALTEGGFNRLLSQGKKIMADYSYLYSQTGVDQATIYTGLLPAEHGIIAHQWYDRLRNKRQDNV